VIPATSDHPASLGDFMRTSEFQPYGQIPIASR